MESEPQAGGEDLATGRAESAEQEADVKGGGKLYQ
jgi:hypothetical protein